MEDKPVSLKSSQQHMSSLTEQGHILVYEYKVLQTVSHLAFVILSIYGKRGKKEKV